MSSTIGVCAIYNRTGSLSVGHVFSPSQSRLVAQEDFELTPHLRASPSSRPQHVSGDGRFSRRLFDGAATNHIG